MEFEKFSQKRTIILLLLLLSAALAIATITAERVRARMYWQQKIDPWVAEELADRGQAEILVLLEQQADLSAAANIKSKVEKGAYVYQQLTAAAEQSQPAIIESLEKSGSEYRRFWVSNMIWVRADALVVEQMARRDDVARVLANPQVKLDVLGPPVVMNKAEAPNTVEQNIVVVRAPEVWDAGFEGQGAVIGGQDTGYEWQHPAIINQYRGWDGSTADHNYNWHDAIHENNPGTAPGNPCGFDLQEPCDDFGHGTHTMGTMVGDDGDSHQIGMAPKAKWIACRNMEQGWGSPASYMECYEWFIAPYPLGGDPFADGDPSKAPHVINNSWSCPPIEGCTEPEALRQVVDHVRAAGILTAHSASNAGPSCGTITDPAAIYDASFTVAATDNNDLIASFSARGPVTMGESTLLKPDISAPGVGVRSSFPGNQYVSMNGTSMASPHVAGLAALLISIDPSLAGDVGSLEGVMGKTAVRLTSSQGCGGDGPDYVPNNVYGWGRIDAYAAYQEVYDPFYKFFAPVLFGAQNEYNLNP
ncbi:MAG: S8 family serine peptidase [Candidatus Promineifilaceae bacterium]|nr:S8 family serine peptidase [Candidatus Promineifilaceae bacterium]